MLLSSSMLNFISSIFTSISFLKLEEALLKYKSKLSNLTLLKSFSQKNHFSFPLCRGIPDFTQFETYGFSSRI